MPYSYLGTKFLQFPFLCRARPLNPEDTSENAVQHPLSAKGDPSTLPPPARRPRSTQQLVPGHAGSVPGGLRCRGGLRSIHSQSTLPGRSAPTQPSVNPASPCRVCRKQQIFPPPRPAAAASPLPGPGQDFRCNPAINDRHHHGSHPAFLFLCSACARASLAFAPSGLGNGLAWVSPPLPPPQLSGRGGCHRPYRRGPLGYGHGLYAGLRSPWPGARSHRFGLAATLGALYSSETIRGMKKANPVRFAQPGPLR